MDAYMNPCLILVGRCSSNKRHTEGAGPELEPHPGTWRPGDRARHPGTRRLLYRDTEV